MSDTAEIRQVVTDTAIAVSRVSKAYADIQALAGVTFEVPKSRVFCILGPNGAGKTTLIKLMTTMAEPDAGTLTVQGFDTVNNALAIRGMIGIVAQENHFDGYLTVWQNLVLHAQLHGLARSVYEPRIEGLLDRIGLLNRRHALPEELSGGMKRQVSLIRALIHEPAILFLDEPTTGLDPNARLRMWELLEGLKETTTMVLTTHYMEEADQLADQLMILSKGTVVMTGTARDLKQAVAQQGQFQVVFRVPEAARYQEIFQAAEWGGACRNLRCLDPYRLVFQANNPDTLQTLFQSVLEQVPPEHLAQVGYVEPDLEDVFLAIDTLARQEET